jgi:hypothetical protein
MSLETCTTSEGRLVPVRRLARLAVSGIYLVRGIPREVQRTARARAVTEGTTLDDVLLRAMREYAVGTWTPRPGVAKERDS